MVSSLIRMEVSWEVCTNMCARVCVCVCVCRQRPRLRIRKRLGRRDPFAQLLRFTYISYCVSKCSCLCATRHATRLTYFSHVMRIFIYTHLWYLSVRFPGLVSCCHVPARCSPDLVHLLLSPDLGLRRWPSPFPSPAASYGNLQSGPLPDADCHSWHFRSAIAATRRSSS